MDYQHSNKKSSALNLICKLYDLIKLQQSTLKKSEQSHCVTNCQLNWEKDSQFSFPQEAYSTKGGGGGLRIQNYVQEEYPISKFLLLIMLITYNLLHFIEIFK